MPGPRTDLAFCLSIHAGYRCAHSAACCSAGWAIPFDTAEYQRVRHVELVPARDPMFVLPAGRGETAALAGKRADGACIFLQDDPHLCAIHRLQGHDALPVTCRMFPRMVLMDPRGTFVSLSHFCPTAASLLFAPVDLRIVEAPASLMNVGPLEGLDAHDAWPPLLRPGVMMDLDAFAQWERFGVDVLARPDLDPWGALGLIGRVTHRICAWTPQNGPLAAAVSDAVSGDSGLGIPRSFGGRDDVIRRAVPAHLDARQRPDDLHEHVPAAMAGVGAHSAAVRRWLAARLFGTWIAYQGEGLSAIVGYLRGCLDVLIVEAARGARDGPLDRPSMMEAIRRADMLIVHLAISGSVARRFSEVDQHGGNVRA